MRISARAWGLVLVLLAAGAGHTSAIGQQAKGSDDTVVVDFHAVSNAGLPIGDLRADEVHVRIDGRLRPVKWLEWIPVADAAPAAAGAIAAPLPPPFATNAARDAGRDFVLAIENDSFRPGRERPLREAVERFLGALTSRDRVAIVTMPYGGFKVDLTNDHARVASEFNKISGQRSASETGSEMACRTRRTLESLAGLVSGFAVEGPTSVLFVTSSMAGPRRDNSIALAPGMCELTVDMFARVGAAASVGRASFYVIQTEDLMTRSGLQVENVAGAGFRGSDNPLEGIEHLAGVTSAARLHLSATGANTLVKIARETAGYYAAGIAVQPQDRNGISRRLEVRVPRPGVEVRARGNITIPRGARNAAARPPIVTPQAMLRDARTFRALPLRGAGFVSESPDDDLLKPERDRLKIVAMLEPTDPGLTFAAAAAGLFDENGRLVSQWTAEPRNLARRPVVGALVAPRRGTYRLRVAAIDAAGRSGTADSEVHADLATAGGLSTSSLVLGLSRGGGFQPRLSFGGEPVALGYVEVYGAGDPRGVRLAAELARTLDGPPIVEGIPGVLRAAAGQGRLIGTVALPIGNLPPGDYLVRLTLAGPAASGRVVRTLRKQR